MTKINKTIVIVSSSVTRLSSMSKRSREAIYLKLSSEYQRVSIRIINQKSDLDDLYASNPDVVVLGMKYVFDNLEFTGPKTWLTDYLDFKGIAYTGSNSIAQKREHNKSVAKKCILKAGLKTAEYFVITADQNPQNTKININYTMFLKPTSLGGGSGIDTDSVVNTVEQFWAKVADIRTLKSDVLCERYLDGNEYSVSIIQSAMTGEYVAMPMQLIAPLLEGEIRILSDKVKAQDAEKALEVTNSSLNKTLSDFALQCFHALGANAYGRIDIRMDRESNLYFLEANLLPSLIDNYGNFPKACRQILGMSHIDMLNRIIFLAENKTPLLSIDDSILPELAAAADGVE